MSESPSQFDFWRIPAFVLWVLLFVAGLVPDLVFFVLREAGHVKTQSALVNSHYMITFLLAGFTGMFTHARCREAGAGDLPARGKALQTAVMGLVAFLPVPWYLLPRLHEIPKLELRLVVLFVCGAKMLAWSYLLSVLMRYYFWNGQRAYLNMFMVLPSMYREEESQRAHADHTRCGVADIESPGLANSEIPPLPPESAERKVSAEAPMPPDGVTARVEDHE